MKHLKKLVRGTKRIIAISLAFILCLTIGFSSNSYAIDSNVSFTSDFTYQSVDGHRTAAVVFQSAGDYKGVCKEFGVDHSESGTAETSRIPNNYNLAKAAYYFGVVLGWEQYLGTEDSRGLTLQCIIQDLNGTIDAVLDNPSMWLPSFIEFAEAYKQRAQNALNAYDWQSVQVPEDFECYACQPNDGSQSFILWKGKVAPATGSLRIVKNLTGGTNRSFTFRIYVEGANGTYSGVTFTNGTATVSVTSGNMKTISGLPAGASYTVSEVDIPTGYTLVIKSGETGTIPDGDIATATFTNSPMTGKIKLKKASANTDITG